MKALVVGDCATSAYVRGLKVLFPSWDVRGATVVLANKWVTSVPPNSEFVQFAQQCDICFGYELGNSAYGSCLPATIRRIVIPPFWFLGLQPDSFHLPGFVSVLGVGGALYSRIVVASFLAGLDPIQTRQLFNSRTYSAFDYLNCYNNTKQGLIDRFLKYGIDLSGCAERWIARGSFLYSYNHPRVDVLMDVLLRALAAADLIPMSEINRKDPVTLQDDLSESNIWPVYPEIAEQHQLTGSLTWRLGRSTNYQTLDLDQFIAASFQKLAEKPLPQLPDFPVWTSRIKSLAAELGGVGNTQSQIG